jgi:predicted nucleotidyltransferase
MWISRHSKSFTNYALKYIENPLFMVVTGSRMYGFNDEESDWDVYAVFVHPSIDLFRLDKPISDKMTPERSLYNRVVSVKAEEAEQVIRKLIDGNMKTFERIFSPEVKMRTEHYYSFIRLSKRFFTQKLITSYLQVIDEDLQKYKDTKNIKYLIYALRSSMTADLLVRARQFTMQLKNIYPYYPDSILEELVAAKINNHTILDVEPAFREIEELKDHILSNKYKMPKKPKQQDINKMNEFLISLRLQYLFSKNSLVKFED